MPRYPYPSKYYVSTEEVGTKYTMDYVVNKLKEGSEAIILNNNYKRVVIFEFLAITSVLFFTGCRISEALKLTYADVIIDKKKKEQDHNWITLSLFVEKRKEVYPKPKKNIPILMGKENPYSFVANWFRDYYLFITKEIEKSVEAKQIKPEDIGDVPLFKYTKHAYYYTCTKYFKMNPHGFRKVLAQYLVVEKRMPLKTVQKILGHSSTIALDYYINLRSDDIKKDMIDIVYKE